jgi:methylase of polypeptide subunit release factors
MIEYPTLEKPKNYFNPQDSWTQIFQKGLAKGALSNCFVYEVGIGSGANIIYMLNCLGVLKAASSDIDSEVTKIALKHIKEKVKNWEERFTPVLGSIDLLNSKYFESVASEVDVIIACIPQIIDNTNSGHLKQSDHIAHYYIDDEFDEYPFNKFGLGLNEALLRQAKTLAPRAEIILNLSGRVGEENLHKLFTENGYEPEILYQEIVPHCTETDITFFIDLEKKNTTPEDFKCSFYKNTLGEEICPNTNIQDIPRKELHHELFVVKGKPIST